MEKNKIYRTPVGDLLEVILTKHARKANLIDVISIESCKYKHGKMNYIDELSEQLEQHRFNLTNEYICLYALQGTPTSYNIPPELDKRINEIKNAIEVVRNSFTQPQQTETKIEQKTIETKPNERIVNSKELEMYFKPEFKGLGKNINFFNGFIKELQIDRTAKEFAQIALMCYNGKNLNHRKPKSFAKWYSIFCENVGCKKQSGYKQNNLTPIHEDIKKLFNYLE